MEHLFRHESARMAATLTGILKVGTMDEAVSIAQQCPGLSYSIRMEVRPVTDECPFVEEVQSKP